jgi:CBS domain containing-hemolysin-like protein
MKSSIFIFLVLFLLFYSCTALNVRFSAFRSDGGIHTRSIANIAQPLNGVVGKVFAWRSSIRLPILGRIKGKEDTNNENKGPVIRPLVNRKMVRRLLFVTAATLVSYFTPKGGFLLRAARASGMITGNPSSSDSSNLTPLQGMGVWLMLFTLSATMHSAESAITKISPWKVQEFAEEEGINSPFTTLSRDMTRLLTTILLTTTACSIYSTALFVTTFQRFFPNASLGFVTFFLTAITLFFGELLPKALAVSNSELVARKLVPPINRLSAMLLPVTYCINKMSDLCLSMAGMRNVEDRAVSEDMLRRVVDEAIASKEGIETAEGRMITSVLDMQGKEVTRIMRPRVEIVAVSMDANATEILQTAIRTRYSRIPVYRGDIDNIVGILFSKDLLEYIETPQYADSLSTSTSSISNSNSDSNSNSNSLSSVVPNDAGMDSTSIKRYSQSLATVGSTRQPKLSALWQGLTASKMLEKTYYIPETMSCWNALQEMRKRRSHMAVVVDEYGGTSGLVTFEDLLEEVVGEIYDEDDEEENAIDLRAIFKRTDGSFILKGNAELDDVFEALDISGDSSNGRQEYSQELKKKFGEYSTIGGLLCSVAGMIPQPGALIPFAGFVFTVLEVEDKRRILRLVAVRDSSLGTNSANNSVDSNSVNGSVEETQGVMVSSSEDSSDRDSCNRDLR